MSTSTHTHTHTHTYTHTCTHMCTHTYIHTLTEPSLTVNNLSTVLDGVQIIDNVTAWLQIPVSKQGELKQQYNSSQVKKALAECFITHHPTPSWMIVGNAIWKGGEHKALEVVQKLYLKGEPCAHSCRSDRRMLSVSL